MNTFSSVSILLKRTKYVYSYIMLTQGKRIIFDFVSKMARRSKLAYKNTRFVLPRERRMYIITSTKRV